MISSALKVFDLYIYSSIHISMCAVGFALYTFHLTGNDTSSLYLLFLGSSTLLLYSTHRIIGMDKVGPYGSTGRFKIINRYNIHIHVIGFAAAIISLWTFIKLSSEFKMLVVFPAILSLLYVLPVFPEGRRLRDMSYIKIFILSACWAWFIGLIPAWNSGEEVYVFISRFFFIMGITLPFDIRDKDVDTSSNVDTLAHLLGDKKAVYTACICLMASFIFIFSTAENVHGFLYIELGVHLLTILLVLYTPKIHHDYYYSFLLDATMAFFIIGFWLGNI